MKAPKLLKREEKLIAALVQKYIEERQDIDTILQFVVTILRGSKTLKPNLHSFKYRLKDPTHLKDKLERKILECKKEGVSFEVTTENLLEKINDLAGIRILHLYTAQIADIDTCLRELFSNHNYDIVEGPFARTWDNESRDFFEQNNINTEDSETLYTSVHYVIASNSLKRITCEIQVRTLSEEVWGEVDHLLNYPHKTQSLACSEQLKVLARVTSSVSRLVDSIFRTDQDHKTNS